MIVKPKIRGFICTTAHPTGCAQQVARQITYVKQQPAIKGPKKVLVLGASTGYGLASRIAATFGAGADTLGVMFEKPASDKRTASAGWYNTAAFEKYAQAAGHQAYSINGDAFSDAIKEQTIALIKEKFGKVDLVIYSLATPRRQDPKTGDVYSSTLKTLNKVYTNKTIDPISGLLSEATIEAASEQEIADTVKVMGGEDWQLWIEALLAADVLAEGVKTVAYSYIGPRLTYPLYREGTIGKAKDHLEATAVAIDKHLSALKGAAYVSVNKALVTQSSAAIPVVPLYIALLFKVMKAKNIHEGCIEQIYRLYQDRLYQNAVKTDDKGLIRIDDWEMREDVQEEVAKLWQQISTENISEISDIAGYREDFHRLFGFADPEIDYEQETEIVVKVPSIVG